MKRLAAVWRERRILTDLQAQEADHNIDAAVDDYHHHMDRRIQQNPPPVDEPEANSDSGDAMSHQSFSEDAPSADSVESAESLFGDSEENRDEDIDHQRQQLLDTLTQEMAANVRLSREAVASPTVGHVDGGVPNEASSTGGGHEPYE